MAENDDGQEKKHAPGDRKWREAAEKGNIPRSADMGSAGGIVGATLAFGVASDWITTPIAEVHVHILSTPVTSALNSDQVLELFYMAMTTVLRAALVPLLGALMFSIAFQLAQTQLQLATSAFEPKWERLNPLTGFQNQYMSWTPLVELAKGLAKVILLSGVTWLALKNRMDDLPALAFVAAPEQLDLWLQLGIATALMAAPMALGIAVGDYAYSYYKLNEQLKRTDRELKDDMKQSDGDPMVKGRRRMMARKMLIGGGLGNVKTADVVVTNPTHFAVALRYKRGVDIAPIVVAKGVDHLAAKIRAEALKCGVPRVENVPLARAMYAQVGVGEPVPEELYAAVAKVLALVMKRRSRRPLR